MPILSWNPGRSAETPSEVIAALSKDMENASVVDAERPQSRFRAPARQGILTTCAHSGCGSSWLRLWRSRSAPIFEGGWSCSAACTEGLLEAALRRETDGRGYEVESHRHRIPLGLAMLEQGWINKNQLRRALETQREAGGGRLGGWLVRQGVSEQLVTRALGLQWSCPVLSLETHDPEGLAPLVPRLFVDAFGALPLRMGAGKILYLGFETRLNQGLALAVEKITGLRVESGLVQGSQFGPAHQRMLEAVYPAAELIEAASEPALAKTLAIRVERARPVESRLARVHDCIWLRMWLRPQRGPVPEAGSIQDVICSVRAL